MEAMCSLQSESWQLLAEPARPCRHRSGKTKDQKLGGQLRSGGSQGSCRGHLIGMRLSLRMASARIHFPVQSCGTLKLVGISSTAVHLVVHRVDDSVAAEVEHRLRPRGVKAAAAIEGQRVGPDPDAVRVAVIRHDGEARRNPQRSERMVLGPQGLDRGFPAHRACQRRDRAHRRAPVRSVLPRDRRRALSWGAGEALSRGLVQGVAQGNL